MYKSYFIQLLKYSFVLQILLKILLKLIFND